jgi:hypothetical protein
MKWNKIFSIFKSYVLEEKHEEISVDGKVIKTSIRYKIMRGGDDDSYCEEWINNGIGKHGSCGVSFTSSGLFDEFLARRICWIKNKKLKYKGYDIGPVLIKSTRDPDEKENGELIFYPSKRYVGFYIYCMVSGYYEKKSFDTISELKWFVNNLTYENVTKRKIKVN